jgi:hypothetical protein
MTEQIKDLAFIFWIFLKNQAYLKQKKLLTGSVNPISQNNYCFKNTYTQKAITIFYLS